MLTRQQLKKYQIQGSEFIKANKSVGLLLDMGLGKTVTTATTIVDLIEEEEISKVLIVAPKRVAAVTWPHEFENWQHLQGTKVSVITGTEAQRRKALAAKADVYTINYENLVWLVAELGGKVPFDMLVLDESSMIKNPSAKRFKALKQWQEAFRYKVILTGTPLPKTYQDLWSQIYILDGGKRLGKTITEYRSTYFRPDKSSGHIVYSYKLQQDSYRQVIQNRISDICMSMKTEDYLELPEMLIQDESVSLGEMRRQYLAFERDSALAIEEEQITALSAGVLIGKLQQFTSGALYTDEKRTKYTVIHDEKIDALEELIESCNGSPLLVAYNFKHSLERISEKLKKYKPRQLTSSADLADWNAGKIQVALGHPQSIGHGLNLQHGGANMCWFDLTWNLEQYMQFNKRLHRTGQKHTVVCKRLCAIDTVDLDIIDRIELRYKTQDEFLEAVKAKIAKYR